MSTAHQILHILRKDVRAHVLELGGVLVLNLLLVVGGTTTWPGIVERIGTRAGPPIGDLLAILAGALIAVWWILIARLIQADLPASRTQFWLTRPYSRVGLLLAKGAGLLVFVHLPLLIAQLLILVVSSVPFAIGDLLANQLLLAATLTLPAATLASLVPTVGRYVLGTVLIVVVALAFVRFSGIGGAAVHLNIGAVVDEAPYALGNWLRLSFLLVTLPVLAIAALIWQYRRRETRRVTAFCLIACVIAGVFVFAFPRSLVTAANTWLVGTAAAAPTLAFRTPTAAARAGRLRQPAPNFYPLPAILGGGPPDWEGVVEIPIAIDAGDARHAELGNVRIDIATNDGGDASVWAGVWRHADGLWLRFRVPLDLYRRVADASVRLSVGADALVYSESAELSISPNGPDIVVDGRERCGVAWGAVLVCRAAFRDRADRVFDASAMAAAELAIWQRNIVSIPWAITPVSVYERSAVTSSWQVPNVPANRRLNQPISVRAVRPSVYLRIGLVLDNLRLADWSL